MSLEFISCTRFYEISAVDNTLHIFTKECIIMILVGIDIDKNRHTFSIIDKETGEILANPSVFNNSQERIPISYQKTKQFDKSKLLIGMEDTGHYHFALPRYLLDRRYTVALINPTTTDLTRKLPGAALPKTIPLIL